MFTAVALNVVPALLTPIFAELHYSAVIVLRVIQGTSQSWFSSNRFWCLVCFSGLGGGLTFPGMHVILAHWAPPNERSVMSNIVYSGTALGLVVSIIILINVHTKPPPECSAIETGRNNFVKQKYVFVWIVHEENKTFWL